MNLAKFYKRQIHFEIYFESSLRTLSNFDDKNNGTVTYINSKGETVSEKYVNGKFVGVDKKDSNGNFIPYIDANGKKIIDDVENVEYNTNPVSSKRKYVSPDINFVDGKLDDTENGIMSSSTVDNNVKVSQYMFYKYNMKQLM